MAATCIGGYWLKDSNMMRQSNNRFRVFSVSCSSLDPYKTLRIHRGASLSQVKKAFRKLALQYHPDVCRGNNSGVQFHQINQAYETVMSRLKGESTAAAETEMNYGPSAEPDWDSWEEWMGWEGAATPSYASHYTNPYI